MKYHPVLLLAGMLVGHTLGAAETLQPDLATVPSGRGWKGALAAATLTSKEGAPAIALKGQEAMVWLDGLNFTDGTIEFDAKGQSAPRQSCFVGVAFRVQDAKTYDAVYFRPFNFRATDPEQKAHAVQYISHPQWTWQKLRAEKTGQFEKPINPAPDGDAWFHAKIVIARPKVSVFVNGAAEPSLVVLELSDRTGGSVGLWSTASGMIANLRITPAAR
jgi:hypothetical protein